MTSTGIPLEDRRAVGVHAAVLVALVAIVVAVAIASGSVTVVLAMVAAAGLIGRALTTRLRSRVAPATMAEVERRYGRFNGVAGVGLLLVVTVVLLVVVLA